MNILFYCDEYPPARNGGIGSVVKVVAEALVKRGHTVVVAGDYSRYKEELTSEEDINGVKIIRFLFNNYRGFYKKILLFILLLSKVVQWHYLKNKIETSLTQYHLDITDKQLEEVIRKYQIDIIELPDYQDFLYNGIKGNIKYHTFSIPSLIRVHGSVSFLRYYAEQNIPNLILENDKSHFVRANHICAVSKFAGNFVQKQIVDKPVKVIYNPIESAFFDNRILVSSTKNILFFGKIVETKGAYDLIRAFNIVAKNNEEVQLVLVGNGNIEEAKKMVDDKVMDRVVFKGFMKKKDLTNEIDKALFCVLPSYFETFSMAAIEVFARKRALIFTIRSTGRELITDLENGLLVEPTDINMLAKKMELLITDSALRKKMAQKGYDSCKERFSTDVIIPQLEKYYQDIINEYKIFV